MANLGTKPSSHDDGLLARLAISTNMLHKSDQSAARSGTIVCPRTRFTTPKVSTTRDPSPHDTDYASSLQYTQHQGHDSINISNLTAPGNRTCGPSGSCSMFVEMANLATIPSSRDDGLVARLAISTPSHQSCTLA